MPERNNEYVYQPPAKFTEELRQRINNAGFSDEFKQQIKSAQYEDSELSPDEVQELAKAKADGRLVERGTWINGYCSNCNSPIPTDNKDDYIAKNECRFCYYCGAKMEEAAEKALEVGE